MAVRQIGAGSAMSAKFSAVFTSAALLLAPVMTTCSAARAPSGRMEEKGPSVFTNGRTTITIDGDMVRLESSDNGSQWSVEAKVKSIRQIGKIRILSVDLGAASLEGIANPMRDEMPADALTANNMRDAGAPEGKVSFIIVPELESGAAAKVRDAHEFTHALLFEQYGERGKRLSGSAEEAVAYAAQIAFGDAKEGLADVLGKASAREGDARTIRITRRLAGELAASLGKGLGSASGKELRDAALAFLDKICMYEFGLPFAQVVDISSYSKLW